MTIPKPSIVASKEDPPYDIIGNGEPTIGNSPKTILIFTIIYKNIEEAKP